ncbi:hypothetical protein BGZ52_000213 [Haplosporangium bisporale]|nr:hypothetical protein BGZ52_000213 [Haplosporangium bisporale]
MELLKENQPPILREAEWKDENLGGLDLLLKAAQKSIPVATKKSKMPSMTLIGSYQAPVIVGRGSQATLNLGRVNKQVSRRHAIVEWCRDSANFQITVLGQNGVRINGTGFPSGQQATLRGGDIVDLVGVKMVFRLPAPLDNTSNMPQLAMSENKSSDNSPAKNGGTKKATSSSIGKDKDTNKKAMVSTTRHSEIITPPPKAKAAPRPAKEVLTKPTGQKAAPKDTPSKGKITKEPTSTPNEAKKQETLVALDTSSQESSLEAPKKATVDYTEMIIDTLVFARKKKSMTLTELYEEMIVSQPSLMAEQDPVEIKEQMLQCLSAARCVDKITRKGKDAYNKPLEDQWYYIPERDHNLMRKHTRQEVMPSARKCTLKDKQYFFKMPPKLPYHRKSASPYAVKPSRRKETIQDDGKEGDSSSDQDDEEDEPTSSRKRKLVNLASVDKKRKPAPAQSLNDDDDDDDVQDSLDDLSELSGLSD